MSARRNSEKIEKLRVHLLVKTLSATECSKHGLAICCLKKCLNYQEDYLKIKFACYFKQYVLLKVYIMPRNYY